MCQVNIISGTFSRDNRKALPMKKLVFILLLSFIIAFSCECTVYGDTDDRPLTIFDKLFNITIISDEDCEIFYRIVEAEATDGTLENKINVASVVLNRLHSGEWGNTVKSVVFAKGQWSPISDGRYYTVKITPTSVLAVKFVLLFGSKNNDMFFCTRTCSSYKTGWFSTLKEDVSVHDSMHAFFMGDKK